MFSNSEHLDSEMKKKEEKYYIILKSIALWWLEIKTILGICKLDVWKPNKWMFSISEPLHNENEKRAIILQFIVIWWLRNLDHGGVCKSNIS